MVQTDDVVVELPLAELMLGTRPGDKNACQKVVRLAGCIENETPVHPDPLLCKVSADGRAASTGSSTPKTPISRVWPSRWDCRGNPHP